LSLSALDISFQSIHVPAMSSAAARAINKIIRTSSLIKSHIAEVLQAVRQLLTQPVEIVDKIMVVEGYTFLIAQSVPAEDEVRFLSFIIIEALKGVEFSDPNSFCVDSNIALQVLKIIFAVGKTLYTTAPAKLNELAWREGDGSELADRVRKAVVLFWGLFGEDFEVMEVLIPWRC